MIKNIITKQKLLTIAGLGWLFDAIDVGLLSFVLAALANDWQLTSKTIAWIGSINSIGMAVGAFLFGLLADRFGRRAIFIFTLLLFSVASGLTALTTGITFFLILRFFIGLGLGGELPVASTLVAESVEPHERGKIIVLLESFWAFGWIIAALIGYFIITDYGWRIAMLLSALPAFYAVYLRINLPDSPHYNAQKIKPKIINNLKMLWSKDYKKATLMLGIVWFCVVFSYYGMFLWLPSVVILKGFDLVKSFEYVLIMTLAQLPGYFTAAWLIDRVGRKFVLITYLLGTAISAYFFGIAETVIQLVLSGMFLSFFNLGAWGALYAYTPEQYPTTIRATGAGTAAGIGRIGGILGPLMIGYMVSYQFSTSTIFTIFCLVVMIAVIAIIFLGKETKQTHLL
ncbi:MFS transporter [Gammaproteobacteria bacterium ESL0073]|nr:MFS transporter [Gammaproteobacteria bacterium ESL0073]